MDKTIINALIGKMGTDRKFLGGKVPVYIAKAARGTGLCVINIIVKAGADKDRIGKEGAAHFLEHMIFCGTNTKNEQEITNTFKETGATFNAGTGSEHTQFTIKTVAEKEYIVKAIKNMVDSIVNSTFPEELIERERTVIQSERASYDEDPDSFVGDIFCGHAFRGTVYEHTTLGDKNSIDNIKREDLIEHYKREFVLDNMYIVIGGSTEELENEMIAACEGLLELPTEYNPGDVGNYKRSYTIKAKDEPVIHTKNLSQTYLRIGYEGIEIFGEDAVANDIAQVIIGGRGMNSRLFKKIRRDMGIAYSVGMSSVCLDTKNTPLIYMTINAGKEEACLNAVDAVMEDLIKDGITDEDLRFAKMDCVSGLVYAFEKLEMIIAYINTFIRYGKNPDYIESYLEELFTIGNEDVNRHIKEIYSNKPLITILN